MDNWIQVGDVIMYHGQVATVTDITYVDDTRLLWAGGGCYLDAEAFPAQWSKADYEDVLTLLNAAQYLDECWLISDMLEQVCVPEVKTFLWSVMPQPLKNKLLEAKAARG